MGGHAKGEVASKLATKEMCKVWVESFSKIAVPELFNEEDFESVLAKGIKNANEEILEYTSKNPEASGMGTTSVCAIVGEDSRVAIANVGDSRAYVISDKSGIRQETKDHSFVQGLLDKNEINEEEARNHPNKNVITKALGLSPSLEPDIKTVQLKNDESLLLCCDGVNAHLSDDDIKKIVQETPDPQHACKKIVDMANDRGGSDNISLIILSKPLDIELDSKKLSEYEDTISELQKLRSKLEDRINKLEIALANSQEETKDRTKGKEEPEFFRNKKEKLKQKKESMKLKAEIAYQKQLLKQQEKEK
jgi:protein phosphatase